MSSVALLGIFCGILSTGSSQFVQLVSELHEVHSFENIVVAHENSSDANRFLKDLWDGVRVPQINLPPSADENLRTRISKNSLIIVYKCQFNESQFPDFRRSQFLLIAEEPVVPYETFKVLWKNRFNYALVFLKSNGSWELFACDPYPRIQVRKVTRGQFSARRTPLVTDMKGYEIRTPYILQKMNYKLDGKVYGPSMRLLHEFFGKSNVNWSNSVDWACLEDEGFAMLRADRVEILAVEIMFFNDTHHYNTDLSYPLEENDFCLLIPMPPELPRFWYLTIPFSLGSHALITCTILYAALALCIACKFSDLRLSFEESVIQCLGCVWALPAPIPSKCAKQSSWSMIAISLQLLVLGFVVNNLYTAKLSSFLTKVIFLPKATTYEELYRLNIPIEMTNPPYEKMCRFYNCEEFERNIAMKSEFSNTLQMRQDFAVFMNSWYWNLFKWQQSRLDRPRQYLSKELCPFGGNVYVSMASDSHLEEPMRLFVMMARQSGLLRQWKKMFEMEARMHGKLNYFKNESLIVRPLDNQYFRTAWLVFLGGVAASLLSLVIENLLFRELAD